MLHRNKWEIIAIDSERFWWDSEHWIIQKDVLPSFQLYLCFVADPMEEGSISEIKISKTFPENWDDNRQLIASICMRKGRFDAKLKQFENQFLSYQ